MLTKNLLKKIFAEKKMFVDKNVWPKFTTYVFPKIGRRPKFTKCVFPKIGRMRFPKSVHGLPAREKLSVFVYTSFLRGAYHVKCGYVRRRKCHVLTKCQNFSGDTVFLQNTFYANMLFSGCTNCGNTYFCPTQKMCTKSRNVCTRLPTRKKLSVFV